MKYLKRIDELKSEVYNQAAVRLGNLGHKKRSSDLAQYSKDTKIKEIEAEQEKAISEYEYSYSVCKEELEGQRIFKLNVPDLENRVSQGGGYVTKKEKIKLFSSNTEFYYDGIFCDEQDMYWHDFIENSESNINFRFVVMFKYIAKKTTREYIHGVQSEISKAYIDTIEAFSINIDTHTELEELAKNLLSEDTIVDRSISYVSPAYCNQIGRDLLISLNNRNDARFILDKLKQTMVDTGPIFKGLYNKFKKQDTDEFDYHIILPALQKAIDDKVRLNVLYRDVIE